MAKSAVVGALRVDLGLDSAQFQTGLDHALGKAKGFSKAAGVALAAAGAAAAGAIAGLVHHGLEFIDAQAKTARSIDGSINGLRALQRAGEDAGVPQEVLTAAMQRMGQALGQAEMGYGTASYALKALGLSAKDLMKMDVDKRLATIADRVHKLGLSAQEASGILGVLGVRSKTMALLMTQGGDAIRKARKEIVDLGLAMSATDAAKVEAANDAISRMGSVTEMISNRITIAFAPALKSLAVWFTALSRTGGVLRQTIDFIGAHIGELGSIVAAFAAVLGGQMVLSLIGVRAGIAGLSLSLDTLKGAILRTGVGILIVALGEAVYWFARLDQGAGGFGKALQLLGTVIREVFGRGSIAAVAFGQMAAGAFNLLEATALRSLESIANGITSAARWAIAFSAATLDKQARGIQFWLDKINKDMGQVHNKYGNPDQLTNDGHAQLKKATDNWNKVWAPLKTAAPLFDAVKKSAQSAGAAVKTSAGTATDLGNQLKLAATKGSHALSQAQQSAKSLTDSMKSAFTGLVTGTTTWRSALSSVLMKLAEIAASSAFSALSGGKGGWLSSLVGGFFGVKVSANANGTENFAGGLTKIHEQGDEIAMLPSGSAVLTHSQSQQLLRGAASAPQPPAHVVLDLRSDLLDARISSGATSAAVQVVRGYDRALPERVQQINADPSAR